MPSWYKEDERRANMETKKRNTKSVDSGFVCLECGHRFKTVEAAERAAFGDHGCPKCGSSDIDLHTETVGGEHK
jgi:Zn finger protein HypA/HybF involved in hydrogenase expression